MRLFLLVALLLSVYGTAQIKKTVDSLQRKTDDTLVIDSGKKDSVKIFRPTISDYLYQTEQSPKKVLDTALTVEKSYIFSQYNNHDNFGRFQFANIGSGFNPLVYSKDDRKDLTLLPQNKSYTYLGSHDIRYYDVKTPTTAFVYHTGVRNGGALQSTYTQNVGKSFNFALEYMGLRSKGHYDRSLASNNNTIFSAHYHSPNSKYEAFAHYIHQNVNNEENGGIVSNQAFLDDTSSVSSDRSTLEVNLNNSNSRFSARRYYLTQEFSPFNNKKVPFKVKHTLFHQANKYYFSQSNLESYYYDSAADLINYPYSSGKYAKNFSNTLSLIFDHKKLKFDAGIRYQVVKLGISDQLITDDFLLPKEIKENRLGIVGNLSVNLFDRLELNTNAEISRGERFRNYLRLNNQLQYKISDDYFIDGHVNLKSSAPSFNYLINPSVYQSFNYYFSNFNNESTLEMVGSIGLKWFNARLTANYLRIDNFTYFTENKQPRQSDSSVNISQIGGEGTFDYGKFHFNTRVLFQNTLTNKELFPAPQFIGRGNLYYQTKAFKNAAEIQTGLKGCFFTTFKSREYFPVLNEFVLPGSNAVSIGGKPIIDAYFNMKVKRMFFFVEAQHLNTLVKQNEVYTVAHYPFYDFRLNIGIVWYLIN